MTGAQPVHELSGSPVRSTSCGAGNGLSCAVPWGWPRVTHGWCDWTLSYFWVVYVSVAVWGPRGWGAKWCAESRPSLRTREARTQSPRARSHTHAPWDRPPPLTLFSRYAFSRGHGARASPPALRLPRTKLLLPRQRALPCSRTTPALHTEWTPCVCAQSPRELTGLGPAPTAPPHGLLHCVWPDVRHRDTFRCFTECCARGLTLCSLCNTPLYGGSTPDFSHPLGDRHADCARPWLSCHPCCRKFLPPFFPGRGQGTESVGSVPGRDITGSSYPWIFHLVSSSGRNGLQGGARPSHHTGGWLPLVSPPAGQDPLDRGWDSGLYLLLSLMRRQERCQPRGERREVRGWHGGGRGCGGPAERRGDTLIREFCLSMGYS